MSEMGLSDGAVTLVMCAVVALVLTTLWLMVVIRLPGRRYGDVRAERIIGFVMLWGGLYFAGTDLAEALLADCVSIVGWGRRSRTVTEVCHQDGPVVVWGTVLADMTLHLMLGAVGAWAMAGRKAAKAAATG